MVVVIVIIVVVMMGGAIVCFRMVFGVTDGWSDHSCSHSHGFGARSDERRTVLIRVWMVMIVMMIMMITLMGRGGRGRGTHDAAGAAVNDSGIPVTAGRRRRRRR